MTQHNPLSAYQRITMTFDPRTTVVTSDKSWIAAHPPAWSLRSAIAWWRAQRLDRGRHCTVESAQLRLRRAPEWADHSADFSPPASAGTATSRSTAASAGTATSRSRYSADFSPAASSGRATLPPQGRRLPATYSTWVAEHERAWWQHISARTVAITVIAAVLTAAVAGSAVIARGDVR